MQTSNNRHYIAVVGVQIAALIRHATSLNTTNVSVDADQALFDLLPRVCRV
jgi:hypothetical protein